MKNCFCLCVLLLVCSLSCCVGQVPDTKKRVTTLNAILRTEGVEVLPAAYNLTIVEHDNSAISIYDIEGKLLVHTPSNLHITYKGLFLTEFGSNHLTYVGYTIDVNESDYAEFSQHYVGIMMRSNPQQRIWEYSSGFRVHIARIPHEEFSEYYTLNLVTRNNKPLLTSDYDRIFRLVDEFSGKNQFVYFLFTSTGKVGLANPKGRIIISPDQDFISFKVLFDKYRVVQKGDVAKLIDGNGKYVKHPPYEFIDLFKTRGGVVSKNLIVRSGGKYGLLDEDLQVQIPLAYDTVFYDNNMEYRNGTPFERDELPVFRVVNNGLSGLYNGRGELIIPVNYTKIKLLARGLYLAENEEKKAVYEISGRKLVLPNFTKLDWFPHRKNNHLPKSYILQDTNQRVLWYNGKAELQKVLEYDDFYERYEGGLYSRYSYVIVEKNQKFGIVNSDGKETVKPIHDSLNYFNIGYNVGQQLVNVISNNRTGLLTLKGDTLVNPIYDKFEIMRDGLGGFIKAYADGKRGVLSPKGEEIIPVRYDELADEPYGQCIVVKNDSKYGAYSKSGDQLMDCSYTHYRKFRDYRTGDGSRVMEFSNNKHFEGLVRVDCE